VAMTSSSVSVLIKARDEASRKFGHVGHSAAAMGSALKRVGGMVAMYFGARQMGSLILFGAAFEKTMSRVGALAEASGKDLKNLTDTAKRLGETTEFTANQVAQGMTFLAQASFKTDEIIAAMPHTLNLASAGQLELSEACDITAGIMRGMGHDTTQLRDDVDLLAVGFTKANMNLSMLGEAFEYMGPLGRTAEKSMVELIATLQVMAQANVRGSKAGTSMRQIMGRLSGSVPIATKAIADLGVETVDAAGKLKSMPDIINQFNKSMADMGPAEKTAVILQIFGQRAGPAMAALVNEGAGAIENYMKLLQGSSGRAAAIAAEQLDNVAGELTKIKSVSSGIVIDIFMKQAEALKNYLTKFREGLSVFGALIDNAGLIMDIVWNKMSLGLYGFWEDIKHFFGSTIPELLLWFGRNWRQIFTDIWNSTNTIVMNMGYNLRNFFVSVWHWLKGEGFDYTWTGLLEGFESTLEELPKIVKREMTATERALREEIDELKEELAANIVAKLEGDTMKVPVKVEPKEIPLEPESKEILKQFTQKGKLEPMITPYLTFEPGKKFEPQVQAARQTAENTRKQIMFLREMNTYMKRLLIAVQKGLPPFHNRQTESVLVPANLG